MKTLNNYITEKLHINNTTKIEHMYHPKTKDELVNIIQKKIDKEGLGTKNNPLDLNDIDTSEITDMSNLFEADEGGLIELSKNGYFNISDWNVSNVKNMRIMFAYSKFNGDLSKWNVSNVEDMSYMFTRSKFTGENGNISKWNINNVENMHWMFAASNFNGDISDWDVSNVRNMEDMFVNCPLENNPPKWYKE